MKNIRKRLFLDSMSAIFFAADVRWAVLFFFISCVTLKPTVE
jgi:hypothetical protein